MATSTLFFLIPRVQCSFWININVAILDPYLQLWSPEEVMVIPSWVKCRCLGPQQDWPYLKGVTYSQTITLGIYLKKLGGGVPPFLGAKQDLPRGFELGLFQLGGFIPKGIWRDSCWHAIVNHQPITFPILQQLDNIVWGRVFWSGRQWRSAVWSSRLCRWDSPLVQQIWQTSWWRGTDTSHFFRVCCGFLKWYQLIDLAYPMHKALYIPGPSACQPSVIWWSRQILAGNDSFVLKCSRIFSQFTG